MCVFSEVLKVLEDEAQPPALESEVAPPQQSSPAEQCVARGFSFPTTPTPPPKL